MRGVVVALGLAALVVQAGCHRAFYRRDADRETYGLVQEHMNDPRWVSPRISIDTPPASRLFDPFNPDRPPLPPDDPAAYQYMLDAQSRLLRWLGIDCPNWTKDGVADSIEDAAWKAYLPLEPNGTLVLTPDLAVEVGLMNSRQYQTQLEDLYLTALALTLNRFEFDTQWFFRNNTFYDHFGSSSLPGESNTLTTNSNLGLTRAFASGGQLLIDFANSFVWEYTGKDTNVVSSNILVSLVQPVLRQAGRRVRLEGLTQAERALLYEVRDFARFRKQFSVGLTAGRGNGYLSLLSQVQNIRNQQADVESKEQNLRLHEALLPLGTVSLIQFDQAFLSVQQSRFALLQSQTGLESSLDAYKLELGLPPTLPIRLDDALLDPFQLADATLTTLQGELEAFYAEYRQLNAAPPVDKLKDGFRRLQAYHERTRNAIAQVTAEIERWRAIPPEPDETGETQRRETEFREALSRRLALLQDDMNDLKKGVDQDAAKVQEARRADAWQDVQKRAREAIAAAAQLFVIQNQVRVYLIRLQAVQAETDEAIQYALTERLDLMNQRARVVDAWRKIDVAANALKADLDIKVDANIRTEAEASNPFDFAASNSSYRVGAAFDAPLNRQRERNIYRTTLVGYQRARRDFMAAEDQIRLQIRSDLRNLQTQRVNFDIARQSLIVAARQVERSRENILFARAADTNSTRDLLDALNSLLQAKSALIGSWVNFQQFRIQLLLDLEALQLDERGLYRHDQELPFDRTASPRDGPGGP